MEGCNHKRRREDEEFEQERAKWTKERAAFIAAIENEKAKAANSLTLERLKWTAEYAEKRSQDAFLLGKQVGEDKKESQELARLMVREDLNRLGNQVTKLKRHLLTKYGDAYQGLE